MERLKIMSHLLSFKFVALGWEICFFIMSNSDLEFSLSNGLGFVWRDGMCLKRFNFQI